MDYNNQKAYELQKEGKTLREIAEVFGMDRVLMADRLKKWRKRNGLPPATDTTQPRTSNELVTGTSELVTDPHQAIMQALNKGVTIDELKADLNLSERILKAYLEEIGELHNLKDLDGVFKIVKDIYPEDARVIEGNWDGSRIIRFGLMGDPQFNSKYVQITHLHDFYQKCANEGIKKIYNTGDVDEGEQMRPGHQYECYSQGADEHVRNIVETYPKFEEITTDFITGNHDHSLIKRAGYDIGKAIAAERPDMNYLGMSGAIIKLTPNCTLELRHPIDGTAYAESYKIQKMIESLSGGTKPNILAVGHYHKASYNFYRNVHAIQTGAFQAQTPWMRGKGIACALGGWIVEIEVDSKGTIKRFKPEFIPYYSAIDEDYKNWMVKL